MKHFCSFFLSCAVAWFVQSCHEKVLNPNAQLTLTEYESLDSSAYKLDAQRIWDEIDHLAVADKDSLLADNRTRRHYFKHRSLVWIDRNGVDHRADSVLLRLRKVTQIGFNPTRFRLPQIEADLKRLRELDFDDNINSINKVVARLEYNLTKAYLRYATGQRFGFVNPAYLLNRYDIYEQDSTRRSYRTLYSHRQPRPDEWFFKRALRMVHTDSVGWFLRQVEPQGAYYQRLLGILNSDSVSLYGRKLLLTNLERCRWRLDDTSKDHNKYVLVNIPAFQLQAVNGDEMLTMRVGCGSLETKTPLLSSEIKRMDVNPQWVIPRSIIKKNIIPRLGNWDYFRSHRYFIRNRQTGKSVPLEDVTQDMIESGKYAVVQEGGEGNSLGRIIFRFDNDLSIYLHDTSSKDVFARENRGVSHGCVRVQYPYELAAFLIGNDNTKMLSRIRYSMVADVSSLGRGRERLSSERLASADTLKRSMLIGSVNVTPKVPVHIVYYTLYPDHEGRLIRFSDVYGYDVLVNNYLRNYL